MPCNSIWNTRNNKNDPSQMLPPRLIDWRRFAERLPFWLLVAAGSFVASIAVYFGVSEYFSRKEAETITSVAAANVNLAHTFKEHVLRIVNDVDIHSTLLVQEIQRNGVRNVDLLAYRSKNAPDPYLARISTFDASGFEMTSSLPTLAPGPRTDREYFFKHVNADSGELFIGTPVISRSSGEWLIPMSRRLNTASGAFAGVLVIGVDAKYISDYFSGVSLGNGGVMLVRDDGIVMVRRIGTDLKYAIDISKTPAFQKARAITAGFYVSDGTVDGTPRIIATDPLVGYPLAMRVGTSLDDALANIRKDKPLYYSGAAALIILLWSGAFVVTGLFSRQRHANREILTGKERSDRLLEESQRAQSERKRAEAALRASEERFRALFDRASDGILVMSPNGKFLAVNEAFARMHGYTTEEMQALNLADLDTPENKQLIAERMQRILAGEAITFEVARYHKDGHIFPLEVSASLISSDGNPLIQAFHRDISERKRVEDALREDERRFRALIEWSPEPLAVHRDGKLLYVNPAAVRMFGASSAQCMLGKPILDRVHPDYHQTVLDRAKNAIDHGIAAPLFEEKFIKLDGTVIDVEVKNTSIVYDGTPAIYVAMRDMTERKRLEEIHLQAQKLQSLGTLAGGIAHDFNNILAAMQGNADLAAEDVGPDHIATESLEEIRKASVRGSELVRRITAFGRPKQAQQAVVDLGEVVSEVLKLLRSTLPASISLDRDFAKDTPQVIADAGQVHEAVVNLTTNAAYAIGPRAGTITYRLEAVPVDETHAQSIPGLKAGHYARLTVTDSGCGMDAATMERVFDAFYTTKPLGEGTGLGLSMVHGTMRSHGGAVTVESALGRGSSFALYFPAAKQGATRKEDPALAKRLLPAAKRVLYVDDEAALVSLASRMLARQGHSISGFTDPREALKDFRTHPQDYDIVMTDQAMPHMSGFELARAARALRPDMPVLMTTGQLGVEDEQRAREAGIREILLKPLAAAELTRVLERLFCAR